ncbi:hypothetical protein RBB50_009447 [Rhinocladiella similis]
MASVQDTGRAKITGDFIVHIPKLYPEKGVYVEPLHEVWFGSLFNGSVARYSLSTKTYEYISIPNVTGRDGYCVAGVAFDAKYSKVWVTVALYTVWDTPGQNLVSPGRLISLDFQGQVIDDVDLTPLEDVAFETNGGHKVSGWGDQVCDANGNVFAVAVWGNVIARWDAVTKKASLYYAEPNPLIVPFSGYTGIENYKDQLLILYNVEYGRIETFNLKAPTGTPRIPAISNWDRRVGMKISGDALLLPPKYDGKVLLMGDNGEGAGTPPQGVRVFISKDAWATVHYLGFVDTTREDGGFPTWAYEIQGSIYVSMMYFAEGAPPGPVFMRPGNRDAFPQLDITQKVHDLVAKEL